MGVMLPGRAREFRIAYGRRCVHGRRGIAHHHRPGAAGSPLRSSCSPRAARPSGRTPHDEPTDALRQARRSYQSPLPLRGTTMIAWFRATPCRARGANWSRPSVGTPMRCTNCRPVSVPAGIEGRSARTTAVEDRRVHRTVKAADPDAVGRRFRSQRQAEADDLVPSRYCTRPSSPSAQDPHPTRCSRCVRDPVPS